MSGHDILIALGVTLFCGVAWLIREILHAPIGFETWRGIKLGTPSDTLDHTTDEHADGRNFGFEAGQFIQHGERN